MICIDVFDRGAVDTDAASIPKSEFQTAGTCAVFSRNQKGFVRESVRIRNPETMDS